MLIFFFFPTIINGTLSYFQKNIEVNDFLKLLLNQLLYWTLFFFAYSNISVNLAFSKYIIIYANKDNFASFFSSFIDQFHWLILEERC